MSSVSSVIHFPICIVGIIALACVWSSLALLFPRLVAAASSPGPSNATAAVAAQPGDIQTGQVMTPTQAATDLACRLCHEDTTAMLLFPSGEELPVQVDLAALDASAHGALAETPLACADCHQPINNYQFPHTPVEAADLRQYHIERAGTCQTCHIDPHLTSHPGPQSETPVVCTDCHGAHDVLTVAEWQAGAGAETCAACHTAAGVGPTDPQQLTALIRDDLFAETTNNDYCLSCHSQPGLALTLANGEVLSLTIDETNFHNSVHGNNPWQPLQCTDCHENYHFPHQPVTAASLREYTLEKYTLCADCHEPKYEASLDSVHAVALAEGNLEAAVCTDCHGAHDTPPPDEPRQRIAFTCGQCHSAIFEEYAGSIHGQTLLSENNPDVPTCIECHGVHNINDPTTALFRVRSPQLCATCHADPAVMNKYDISTAVFETYVADFHGTTVTLFEHQDPTVETNKAVCYDCHGVHDIHDPDDPAAGIKANLLETCQQCHPDATTNFPDTWTSHFRPSLQNNPLVFLVNLFYQVVVPATVGFFGFLVVTDVYRRVRLRRRTPEVAPANGKPAPAGELAVNESLESDLSPHSSLLTPEADEAPESDLPEDTPPEDAPPGGEDA